MKKMLLQLPGGQALIQIGKHAVRLVAIAIAALVGGCAAISQGECEHANWYERGRADAYVGRTLGYLDTLAQSCAEYGLRPDRRAYEQGHREGLTRFCTADRGYEFGRQGGRYYGTCPNHLAPAFLSALREGEEIYRLEREVTRIKREIDRKERRLRKLSTKPKSDEKKAAKKQRREQRYRLRDDLRQLDRELFHAEQQLLDAQSHRPSRG